MSKTFTDLKVSDAILKLESIGDAEHSLQLKNILLENPDLASKELSSKSFNLFNPAWKGKEHAYGYLNADEIVENKIPLMNSISMTADQGLKGTRVNIKVGNIYIDRYPGILGGSHEILFDFSAKHSPTDSQDEQVKFTQKYSLRNGGGSSEQGLMAVLGLRVPKNGIEFSLNTIYLENQNEQKLLRFLNTDAFKSGLKLLTTANPLVAQAAGYAIGITQYLTEEKKNMVVQKITLGLDFANTSEVASIKLGTYVAIQAKREDVIWSEWYYDTNSSLIRNRETNERMPYNHITFVISQHQEE